RIINRINVFDDEEYNSLVRNFGQDLRGHIDEDSKIKIYLEHIDYVDDLVKQNKEILTKFDTLLLELSKLDAIDSQTFEQLQAIEDINNLITSTKYYKN
ncbi:MAG: hypothetical protein K6G26_05420, partial [Lachnospiraceae bacterium]|nr:hypothetical protein [Lachnospiraceae bacterium]